MQVDPAGEQSGLQNGDVLHDGSVQSAPFAQSSSRPFPQISGPVRQSRAQFAQLSPAAHVRSPQQYDVGLTVTAVQLFPPDRQRESVHETGFAPAPSRQQ